MADRQYKSTIPVHTYDLGDWHGQGRSPSTVPHWLVAVYHLGRPVTYSRVHRKSIGTAAEGAISRREAPYILEDVVQLHCQRPKRSHTKNLTAVCKPSANLLNKDVVCEGDWVMAWMFDNKGDYDRVRKLVEQGKKCNGFRDGLKFLGRVWGVRKNASRNPDGGPPQEHYTLQGLGFAELDTNFWYDHALASSASQGDLAKFMAQIGLDYGDLIDKNLAAAGHIKDNADLLIVALVNIILGAGAGGAINDPAERAAVDVPNLAPERLRAAPQHGREAPAAYLVPRGVGLALGRTEPEASKDGRVFGYSDILDTLIGTQDYFDVTGFYPKLDRERSLRGRKFCTKKLKGTFLPVNLMFVNQPLWALLQQYLNPHINEMYTAMKLDETGDAIVPTLVARQHPLSTQAMVEHADFPLTPFLTLPRWKLPTFLWQNYDLGGSNAMRCNLVHVYGKAMAFAKNKSESDQLARNPPIVDTVDSQRSGIHAQVGMVECALEDVEGATNFGPAELGDDPPGTSAATRWMEAIADWSFDGQLRTNGSITCFGIQAPIAEGDNLEFDGVAYQIESIADTCSIEPEGHRTFRTTLNLTYGMPIDQSGATDDYPAYVGLTNHVTLGHADPVSAQERSRTEAITEGSIGGGAEPDSTASAGDPAAMTGTDTGKSVGRG